MRRMRGIVNAPHAQENTPFISLTETSQIALPQDVTATVTYPSETYSVSMPYTSIGQRSELNVN